MGIQLGQKKTNRGRGLNYTAWQLRSAKAVVLPETVVNDPVTFECTARMHPAGTQFHFGVSISLAALRGTWGFDIQSNLRTPRLCGCKGFRFHECKHAIAPLLIQACS